VLDNAHGGKIPSYMRSQSAAWVTSNKEPLERLCVAKALVIGSAALRFLKTTLMLLTSHAIRDEACSTREDAVDRPRRRLDGAGAMRGSHAPDGWLTTDESRWPIVVHPTIGVPSPAEVETFMRRADAILARRAVHAVVFDNSQAGPVPAYMRKSTLDWLSRNREELERYCVG